jgi:hypothetical protein
MEIIFGIAKLKIKICIAQNLMAYHTTHNEHYILLEPEHEYLEIEDLDDIIGQILGDFSEVSYVIFFIGTLEYFSQDDLEQLLFLNEELVVKGGYLILVSTSENVAEQLKDKINIASSIDEAIDTIESEWLDKELFSEES